MPLLGVGTSNTETMDQTISVLFKLEERYDFFRRLRGDKWEESVKGYEPFIRQHMEADGTNEIEAALKLGKILEAGGHDPNELFAVAVHMTKREVSPNVESTREGRQKT